MAIQIEKNGEAIYREAVQKVSGSKLKDALKWMADEEVRHREWFQSLKNTIKDTPGVMADTLTSDMLETLMGDQVFTLKEVDFSRIAGSEELARIFIEFEKDSIIFYEMLAGFIKNRETRNSLQKIISEEKQHIQQLEAFTAT
jgi:rubrerythrin